jgi:MFS family permease
MLFDFADRQVVGALFPLLKAEWALSDLQLGLLSSMVSIIVAVGVLPISLLLDRGERVRKMSAMAAVWSLATLACAFAASYPAFLAGRVLIGVGQAGFAPAGGALLSAVFPARWRATVLGTFQAAASVGSILGVAAGGVMAGAWGWRAALGILALPGLLLAVMALWIREPASRRPAGPVAMKLREVGLLLRPRSALAAYLGGAMQLLLLSTLYAWLPTYFGRAYGWPVGRAALATSAMLVIGSCGIVLWGHLADRLSRRHGAARLWLPAVCGAAGFLALSPGFGWVPPGATQLALIALGSLLATATIGPLAAAIVAVAPPWQQASALGMLAAIQNLFGLAAGPLVAGALSDAFRLRVALAVLPATGLLAAAILAVGARFHPEEVAPGEPSSRRPAAMAAP